MNPKGQSNKGRRLQAALKRFASMLIEEAQDLTGMTFAQLDEKLVLGTGFAETGLCPGQSSMYARGLRGGQPMSIQRLEERVARLLKRQAHKVVIINTASIAKDDPFAELDIGAPTDGMNLRSLNGIDLQLGYEDDWPTYRYLKYGPAKDGIRLIDEYWWQWGIHWNSSTINAPGIKLALQLPPNTPLESLLRSLVQQKKLELLELHNFLAPLRFSYQEMEDDEIFPMGWAKMTVDPHLLRQTRFTA